MKKKFTTESRTILIKTAKCKHGQGYCGSTLAGLSVSVGNEKFCITGDARSEAVWRKAVDDLLELDLIRSPKGEVFTITDDGYKVAEKLEIDPNYEYEVEGFAMVNIENAGVVGDNNQGNAVGSNNGSLNFYKDQNWWSGYVWGVLSSLTASFIFKLIGG